MWVPLFLVWQADGDGSAGEHDQPQRGLRGVESVGPGLLTWSFNL